MTTSGWVDELETELRLAALTMTAIDEGECLVCYTARMLADFQVCNGHLRWAAHHRDARAPRATGLEHRLGRLGAFCDCEIFHNAYVLHPALAEVEADDTEASTWAPPACRGVRRGSTQPCSAWVRRRPW